MYCKHLSPIHKSILFTADTDTPVKTLKKCESSDTMTIMKKIATEDLLLSDKG